MGLVWNSDAKMNTFVAHQVGEKTFIFSIGYKNNNNNKKQKTKAITVKLRTLFSNRLEFSPFLMSP